MSAVRTAIVSGASRGIGLAVATGLAAQGARVVMFARSADALREAARGIGDRAIPIPCDVADPGAIAAALEAARRALAGAPDLLVNNAGIFELTPLHDLDPDDFARALQVNLAGPFRLIRAVLPHMRAAKQGHIISIGSIADRVAFPDNGAYAAAKFGLRGMHEVLRKELSGSGVRSTLVSPGPVDTSMWDAIDPDNRPGFLPRASMLQPEAVAAAVLFAATLPAGVNVDELRLSHT